MEMAMVVVVFLRFMVGNKMAVSCVWVRLLDSEVVQCHGTVF